MTWAAEIKSRSHRQTLAHLIIKTDTLFECNITNPKQRYIQVLVQILQIKSI